jgi:plasmid maintenance system antidote protein VapI
MNAEFSPSWVSPPGETIDDLLKERGITAAELAIQLGMGDSEIDALSAGRKELDLSVANKLEAVFGGSAEFWVAREQQYRQGLRQLPPRITDSGTSVDDWLSDLPIKDMVRFGWIPATATRVETERVCLDFFGLPSVDAWHEAYRQVQEAAAFRTSPSFESQPGAVAAWLRQGELVAQDIACRPWDSERFRTELTNIRALTRLKEPQAFIPELANTCADCGVAAVVVRAPLGCRASGATRFLSAERALLLLSFRYLSDDHFWFTFFHEAAHLLLHGKDRLFLEGASTVSSEQEHEANRFAADLLIPPECRSELMALGPDSRDVLRFARQIGVSPGIVVGQLQHLGIVKRSQLNSLKRRFHWAND